MRLVSRQGPHGERKMKPTKKAETKETNATGIIYNNLKTGSEMSGKTNLPVVDEGSKS